MTSRLVVPPDPGRPRPRVPLRTLLTTVVLAALALGVVGFGAGVSAGEDPWSRAASALLVLVCLLGCAVLLVGSLATRTGRLVLEERDGVLRLPGSRVVAALLLAALATCVVLPVVLVVGRLVGSGQEASGFALAASALLLVLAVPLLVALLRGRVRLNALELAPDAVTYRSYNASSSVGWADLTEVRLVADPGRRLVLVSRGTPERRQHSATPGEATVGRAPGGRDEVSVPVGLLASDAVLVAELVEACRTSPERRAELGTPAAVERLRSGIRRS